MKTLAERLTEERELTGLTQAELAKKAKCSQATIADIERGRNAESAKLPNISAALNLHSVWLKDGVGPKYLNQTIASDGIYVTNPQLIAALKIMEALPDYALSAAVKDIAEVAELVRRAKSDHNGTDG